MKNTEIQNTRQTIARLNKNRAADDRKKVENIGRSKQSALAIFDAFCKEPELDITKLVQITGLPRPTITNTIRKLCDTGVISQVNTGKEWGKKYRYNGLICSVEDFSNNTTRTQNANGLHLLFNNREFAEKEADTPIQKTFLPYKYHNSLPNNRNSNNKLYIGDNLQVMKQLLSEGKEQFSLIYLDVPYHALSTRKQQCYNDDFSGTCDFLAFLYPRLQLAKRLLKQDGMIALSISENEEAHLKIILDEIFERKNIVNNIVIESGIAAGPLSGYVNSRLPVIKSYLLVYAKDKSKVKYLNKLYDTSSKHISGFNIVLDKNLRKSMLVEYLKTQKHVIKLFKKHNLTITNANIEKLIDYDAEFEEYIYTKLAKKLYKRTQPFANPLKNDFNAPTDEVFEFDGKLLEKSENGTVYHLKPFLNKLQENDDGKIESTMIRGDIWKGYFDQKSTVQKEGGVVFNAAKKPVKLIRDLLKWIGKKDAVIGDFFAGSGTTAEAVMRQNKYDNGNRSFVLCQIPEKVNPKSEEAKAGFKTVDQITIKRIKNAIKELNNDDGFQIFK